MSGQPAHADSLEDALAEAFRLLARGVADRRGAFHTPALATVGLDDAPRVRTVVLRGFDAGARRCRVHTDRRAAKVGELAREPRVALHAYDPDAAVQVRLGGPATVHLDGAEGDAASEASRPASRLTYAVRPAPGTAVAAPPPVLCEAADGMARGSFAVLGIAFDRLEWLWLSAAGHRRARFAWDLDGALDATWLVP